METIQNGALDIYNQDWRNLKGFASFGESFDLENRLIGRFVFLGHPSQQAFLDRYCESWLQTYHSNPEFHITLDLETTGLDYHNGEIVLVSISWDETHALVFVPANFSLDGFLEVINTIPLDNQNLKFDTNWLRAQYGVKPKVKFCTMVGAQLGYCGYFKKANYDLKSLAEGLKKYKLLKEIRMDFPRMKKVWDEADQAYYWVGQTDKDADLDKSHIAYSAQDTMVTNQIVYPIINRLVAKDLWDVWLQAERPLIEHFSEIETRGICLNKELGNTMYDEAETQLKSYYDKIQELVAAAPEKVKKKFTKKTQEFNPGSVTQLDALLQWIGIKVKNTKEETLLAILGEYHDSEYHELLQLIVDFRKKRSELTKYLKPWLTKAVNPKTGLIHPSIRTMGSDGKTGRLSASDPNIMAVQEKMRPLIVARPGYKLLSLDLSQFELRAAAAYSGEPSWMHSFEERARLLPLVKELGQKYGVDDPDNFVKRVELPVEEEDHISISADERKLTNAFSETDVHKQTAALIFAVPVAHITKKQRKVAKTLNYALLYGAAEAKIQLALAKDGEFYKLEQCKKFKETFFSQLQKVDEYTKAIRHQVHDPGYICTPLGRKKFFQLPPAWKVRQFTSETAEAYRQAVNAAQQMPNVDVIKYSIGELTAHFNSTYPEDHRPRIIFPVHDEIVVETPDDLIAVTKELCEETLIKWGQLSTNGKVPIEVSSTVGPCWGH